MNYRDPLGNIAIVDDVILGIGLLLSAIVTATVVAIVSSPPIQEGWNDYVQSFSHSTQARDDFVEKEKDAIAIPNQKEQAYFPLDPYDFVPKGLIRKEFPGSRNGRIMEWRDPISNVKVSEWDEDLKYGSHYHAMQIEWDGKHNGCHYLPGTPVPEPWNSIYFGG